LRQKLLLQLSGYLQIFFKAAVSLTQAADGTSRRSQHEINEEEQLVDVVVCSRDADDKIKITIDNLAKLIGGFSY